MNIREQALENELESLKQLQIIEHKERIDLIIHTLRNVTNGEWDEIKEINPGLHAFIRQATNR